MPSVHCNVDVLINRSRELLFEDLRYTHLYAVISRFSRIVATCMHIPRLYIDHISGSGRAIGPVCVCLYVCPGSNF